VYCLGAEELPHLGEVDFHQLWLQPDRLPIKRQGLPYIHLLRQPWQGVEVDGGKYSGTPYSKMSSGTPRAYGAASMIGPEAPATLETGLAPVRLVRRARTTLAASGSSDTDISLRLEQVTKSNRF